MIFVNIMIIGDYILENFGKADGMNEDDWS